MTLSVYKVRDRTYLAIKKGYRNAAGKSTKKTIKSLGYLDELEKQYPDPIAHFREVARQMTEEEKATRRVQFAEYLLVRLPFPPLYSTRQGF